MKLSVKHSPLGKPLVNKGSILTYQWQAVSLSISQIVKHITSGKPVAVGQFRGGHRNKKHFLQSDLIALDYDGNYRDDSYQALISSDFFRRYAFAIIQTASSKPNSRRCRVLFQLDRTITSRDDYAALVLFIISIAPEGADRGARDATRAFYGSKPGTVPDFYNPANVLAVAPFLEEIEKERQREREVREKRRDIELSGDLIKDIEKALGVTGYNADHWSNPLPCIKGHEHDDRSPAAYWNEDSHILFCFKCGGSHLAKDVAGALGIEYIRAAPLDNDADLSAAPEDEVRPRRVAKAYSGLAALPSALRKAMIKDGATNLCRLIDALLWEDTPTDHIIHIADMVKVMRSYGMKQAAVYRVMVNYSQFLNALDSSSEKMGSDFENNSGRGRKAGGYTLGAMIAVLERRYSYSIHSGGNYLYAHDLTLSSAREYRQYALLETLPCVENNLSLKELGEDFGLSAGTMSGYTRELRDQGLITITPHYKHRELTADDLPRLSLVLTEWKAAFSNAYIEMYTLEDGLRVPFNHKGGKRKRPNNRIPALYSVVMFFFEKSLKKHTIKSVKNEQSNLTFVLVSKLRNSYRRLPVPVMNNPLLSRLMDGIAA
jgi:hypothetical protein